MGNYLFNGMKLLNIDSIWTDKETFPYVIVYTGAIPTEPVTYYSMFVCMSVPCIYDGTSIKSSETALRGLYRLQDGVWTLVSEGVTLSTVRTALSPKMAQSPITPLKKQILYYQ